MSDKMTAKTHEEKIEEIAELIKYNYGADTDVLAERIVNITDGWIRDRIQAAHDELERLRDEGYELNGKPVFEYNLSDNTKDF